MEEQNKILSITSDIKDIICDFILLTPEKQILASELISKILEDGKKLKNLQIKGV